LRAYCNTPLLLASGNQLLSSFSFFTIYYILNTIYFFIIILHASPEFLQTFKKKLFIFKKQKGNSLSLPKPLPFLNFYLYEIFYILPAGRARTGGTRAART